MASKVKHSFKEAAIAIISGNWANRVGRFCSYWMGCDGVTVELHENPSGDSPNKVGLNYSTVAMRVWNELTNVLGIAVARLQNNTPDPDTAGQRQADLALLAPKPDKGWAGTSETDAEKVARIGVSKYAAREDHEHPINVDSTLPSDCVKNGEDAEAGTSSKYARIDHVHQLPELSAEDIVYGEGNVGGSLDDHEDRITALEEGGEEGAVTSVNGKTGAVVLTADDIGYTNDEESGITTVGGALDEIITALYDVTSCETENVPVVTNGDGGIQALSVQAEANSVRAWVVDKNQTVPTLKSLTTADIYESNCTDRGNCFAVVGSDGYLTHSQSLSTPVQVSKVYKVQEAFNYDSNNATLNWAKITTTASAQVPRAIGFAANQLTTSLLDIAILTTTTAAGADTATGSVGTAAEAARADHTHPKSDLYAEDEHTHSLDDIELNVGEVVNYKRMAYVGANEDYVSLEEFDISMIEAETTETFSRVVMIDAGDTEASFQMLLSADLNRASATTDGCVRVIGFANGSTTASEFALKTSNIYEADCEDEGNCFVIVGEDGYLTHSQSIEGGPEVSKMMKIQAAFSFDEDDGYLNLLDNGKVTTAPTSDKVLVFKSGSTTPSLMDYSGGGSSASVLSFLSMAIVTKKNASQQDVVDYVKVYLPNGTSIKIWNQTFNFRTGSSTGYLSSLGSGWYKINGITSGTLYLNDDSYKSGTTFYPCVKFATSALADTTLFSRAIGTISGLTIKQNGPAMSVLNETAGASVIEHSTKCNDSLLKMLGNTVTDISSQYMPKSSGQVVYPARLDTNGWTRDVTATVHRSSDSSADTLATDSTEKAGVRLQTFTRVYRSVGYDIFYWRYLYFDRHGMLKQISAEQGCYIEMNPYE